MSIARSPSRHSSGVVLVIVLIGLALMMVLLLALFEGTLQQSHGAASDVLLNREKMLADSAVALVIGQIVQASTQTGQTWISQPGLLRTYATSATRAPTRCYKLYSTPNLTSMIDTSGTLAFMANDIPANWSTLPAQYTDLNAPVQTADLFGAAIYPILDPGAVTPTVPGVSTDNGPGQVQMPVAWLYELQDGTLGPASNGTAANPIVARIAFWTDDETSKINVNTAGCGAPWNTPRVNSPDDLAWSTHQPAAGEYSAYPGHPATTSLALVFSSGTGALTPQQLLGLTPRYAWGGSQFGSQTTTPGATVLPKINHLYASVDELTFSSSLANGTRVANLVTPSQLNTARFVLTAHSNAPETTLLGEPRVAIWPVSDGSTGAPGITATDRAVMTASTVGAGSANPRKYYFQRYSALNSLDDFDPGPPAPAVGTPTASNVQLFTDLVNRGSINLPGYGSNFVAKYPDPKWTQLMLEITDFIHATNAVDPSAAPFVSFAHANSSKVGVGFVQPLTWTYAPGTPSQVTLRGIGRCPTLSSLTFVFYVCGFRFKPTTPPTPDVDFDQITDDTVAKAMWDANFKLGSPQWKNVASELIRCFIVPCTYQPGCGFPEVSDACSVQISNLTSLSLISLSGTGNTSGTLSFPPSIISLPLGTPLTTLPADRAWGGNEGPSAWRAAGDAMLGGAAQTYPFASTNSFPIPMKASTPSQLDPSVGGNQWPQANRLSFPGMSGLTVQIKDLKGNPLQTFTVNLQNFNVSAPTINGECDHADTPPFQTTWASNPNCVVEPWWYMCLRHRLLTSQNSRAVMIQAGDVTRSIEAGTDLRVMAGLASVPASMFQLHPGYSLNSSNTQGGSFAHNFRFADGTSACFAGGKTSSDNLTPANQSYGWNIAVKSASYPSLPTTLLTVSDWRNLSTPSSAYYNVFAGPPCSVPTGISGGVTISSGVFGDWDTGPGLEPDGAMINLPDSGTTMDPTVAYGKLSTGEVGDPTQRTPNALIPSPVVFGSLPAGIDPSDSGSTNLTFNSKPWCTLLFCPYPASNTTAAPYTNHPGATTPPDHLLLDYFWMPVVEPYAISTCMATAGKVNLNDQIAPFTYLHRSTALRALLDDLRIPAIPIAWANAYKSSGLSTSIWNLVDPDATIAQIENRFANGSPDAYLSESEICTVPLVPKGVLPSGTSVTGAQSLLSAFWGGTSSASPGGLTGDNLRELPYAQLYGRLTTRSNSYTVHVRVQVLKKLTSDPNQNVWNEGTDVVLGDWRGSYEIERYLDPSAPAPTAGTSLASSYKFRVVSSRAFTP